MHHRILLAIAFLGLRSLVPYSAHAQQTPPDPATAVKPMTPPEGEAKSAPALRALMANIDSAEVELAQKRELFQKAETPAEKASVGKDMDALRVKIDGLRLDFASLAAGRDWRAATSRQPEKFDTAQELEQLLQPIVRELKDLTAKPRELDSLRSTVGDLSKRAGEVKAATEHLAALLESMPEGELKNRLLALRGD